MQINSTVADAFLSSLTRLGIEVLFYNAGTDFPPIAEAFARAEQAGMSVPRAILVPHENVAVSAAHGYYMTTGKMAAVMVHVGLGTANSINAIFNASRQNIPLLLIAGRTPWTEEGVLGSRDNYIHWAQEMFDQPGMLRELVKWDFELKHPAQLRSAVDRAIAVAQSGAKGPVYMVLPREVLACPAWDETPSHQDRIPSVTLDAETASEIARLWQDAERPLVITSSAGENPPAMRVLEKLAETTGTPVVHFRPRYAGLAADHVCHGGWDAQPFLATADFILVLDSDVPWIPAQGGPGPDCKIVHIAPDALFSSYPLRGFPADISANSDVQKALLAIGNALAPPTKRAKVRMHALQQDRDARTETRKHRVAELADIAPIHPAWVSHCIDSVCGPDVILINEYPLDLSMLSHVWPGRYFSHSPAGGLGWALGAAQGAKLAHPDKTVVAAVGDGAYMFGNPVPAHYCSKINDLPTLTIVFNNGMWLAVHRSTLGMYPDGLAARANNAPLSQLDHNAAFEEAIKVSGGWGERVTEASRLTEALARALDVVRNERRSALLNVVVQPVLARAS